MRTNLRFKRNRHTHTVFPVWKYSDSSINGTAKENLPKIRNDYLNGYSIRDLSRKYGIVEEVIKQVVEPA